MPSMSECRHAVLVVELGLGDRVVDVDRREQQRAGLRELVQAVHAGGGLLGDADDVGGHPGVLAGALDDRAAQRVEDDAVLLGVVLVGRGDRAGGLELDAHVDQQGRVTAVVDDRVRAGAVGPGEHLLGAPPVLLQRLALPGVDGDALRVLGVPFLPTTIAAAAWSWVEKMLQLTQRTSAPRAASVSMRTAVCTVMCSEPATFCPSAAVTGRTRDAAPSGQASRARRGRSPCGRTRPATGRRP